MRKSKFILLCAVILGYLNGQSQNLVNNPSFESAAWANGNNGSVDWLTGPTNVFGTENARTGTRFMGESMGRSPAGGATDFREYITNSLTSALIPGNTYECSIWVSLSENYGSYACNSIGFVTTNFSPNYAFNNAPPPLTPVYATPTIQTNKVGWTQIFGTFVATAADTWVTIGNFNSQAATAWSYVGPATGFYYGYYFMDDVCLGPPGACSIILPIEILSFEGKSENRKVRLDWITSSELHCDHFIVERSSNGKTFEEIGQVKGNGNSNTAQNYTFIDEAPKYGETNYYRLHEFDSDGKSHYSNMVSIEPKGDLNIFVKVFPVPSNQKINLEINANNKTSVLTIYNSIGNIVFEKNLFGYSNLEVNNLIPGNYVAVLKTAEGKTVINKFIITD